MSDSQKINNQILDAFGIVIDSQLRKLKFDKTIQASIVQSIDASAGSYKVRYQNSTFTAYSTDPNIEYKQGDSVYVSIHMNNVEQNSTILGTVSKLGTNYITEISEQNKYNILGSNLLIKQDEVYALNSYTGSSIKILKDDAIDQVLIDTYKNNTDALQIVANIRTELPYNHQIVGGDYGIKVKCAYYDPRYPEHSSDHLIYRQYTFNTTKMTGQPYKYNTSTRQQTIFGQIDGENLYKIEDIIGFASKFEQSTAAGPDDIFLSNIQLNLLQQLTREEINGASLTIETLNAVYFDDSIDTIELKAIPKIKGKIVNLKQNSVAFYWFIKDNSVTNSSLNYQQYGGFGWRCLNSYTENDNIRNFNRGNAYYSLTKDVCLAFDTKIKCIAVFEERNFTTAETVIDIFNNTASQERVTLTSTNGVTFNFNRGTTTLKAAPANNSYTYYWSESRDGNPYEEIAGVHGSEYTPNNLTSFLNTISYSVTIYNDATYVGSADISLVNGQGNGEYQLILHNGTQIFHYNNQGVSPTTPAADIKDRIKLTSLSFDIIDPQGRIINFKDDIQKINQCKTRWILPQVVNTDTWKEQSKYTMLTIDNKKYSITDGQDNSYIINSATLEYGIIDTYDASRKSNNIQLQIEFDGHRLNAQTDFTFLKDGDSGTNATKYVTRILPSEKDYDDLYLIVHKKTDNSLDSKIVGVDLDGTLVNKNINQLKVQVYDGTPNPLFDGYSDSNLTWSLLKHLNDDDIHNLTISEDGKLSPNLSSSGFQECADIIQANITNSAISNGELTCYGNYPVISEWIKDEAAPANFEGFKVHQGFREVVYNTDGTRGQYSTLPFVLTTSDDTIDNSKIIWYTSWQKVEKTKLKTGNTYAPVPPNIFNYGQTNQYVVAILVKDTQATDILKDDNIIAKVVIPIYFHLNQYGLHAMSDWNGNSIKIKDDKYILAPQIGVGQKNSDNTFTGVTFGKTFNSTDKKEENGLFAYNHGQRTVFIDANNGSSYFGISGKGQIQLLPDDDAIIQSGNYSGTAKNGLQINLTKPYIKYGNGNFEVNEQGVLRATGATVDGTITTSVVKIKYNNVVKDAIIPCPAQSLTTGIQNGQIFDETDQGLSIASNYSAVKIASEEGSLYTGTLWATGQVVSNINVISKQLVAANLAYGSRIELNAEQNGNAGIELSGTTNYIDFKGNNGWDDYVVRMSQSNGYTVSFTGKQGTGVTIAAAVFAGTATNAINATNAATLTGNATAYDGTQRRPILVHGSAEKVVKCISSNSDGTISVWGKWGGSTLSAKSFRNSGSDRRLKKNIKNSTLNALQLINKIKHREFIKIDENNRYEAVGYIAQELEEIDPNLVIKPHSEDEYYSVDTFYLLGVVTKSIQELYHMYQKIIEEL